MIPATITLRGIWAALIALAFAIALALLAVQTVRLEGLKIWPLHIEGWKPKAERLQGELDRIKAAQLVAQQKAIAAKAKAEADYRDLAGRIDTDAKQAHDSAMADAERYIAAHRVRGQAAGSSAGRTVTAAEDHSASGGQSPGAAPVVDEVAVSPDDVRICTTNTIQAETARQWAIDLETSGSTATH